MEYETKFWTVRWESECLKTTKSKVCPHSHYGDRKFRKRREGEVKSYSRNFTSRLEAWRMYNKKCDQEKHSARMYRVDVTGKEYMVAKYTRFPALAPLEKFKFEKELRR